MPKGDKLTGRQKKFVMEYLVDLNATQAAIRAGYSERTAKSVGCENLTKPDIQVAIQEAQKELAKRVKITPELVLQEYARLGFLDPRKFFRADGSPIDITELDDDTAAALAGLEVMEIYEGRGDDRTFVGYLKKYKLTDKKGALDSIAKHLGMFVERHEHTGKNGEPIESNVTVVSRTAGLTKEQRLAMAQQLMQADDDPGDILEMVPEGTE